MITVELTAAIDTAGTTETFYFSDAPLITDAVDTPANTAFESRILDPGSIARHAFSDGKTGGMVTLETGEIELDNLDGGLDYLITYSFDNRAAVVRYHATGVGAYPASWTTLFKGTNESIEPDLDIVVVKLADKLKIFDKPICKNLFAGNNALPNGVEGVIEDLKGKPKPRAYGFVLNAPVPMVNTSNLVYLLSDNPSAFTFGGLAIALNLLLDRGVQIVPGAVYEHRPATFAVSLATVTFTVDTGTNVLTTGSAHGYTTMDPVTVASTTTLPAPLLNTNYYFARSTGASTLTLHPTQADATNNTNIIDITTVGSGTHNISNNRTLASKVDEASDSTGSWIRLGTSPTGQVTANFIGGLNEGAFTPNYNTAKVLENIVLDAGLPAGEISSSDVTALGAANDGQVGIYINDQSSVLQAMSQIANTAGAWFGFDATGTLRMGQLTAPIGSAVLELNDSNIIDIERRTPRDLVTPTWRVTVKYAKNWLVQTSDFAGSAPLTTRQRVGQEWRSASDSDVNVKTQWLNAQDYVRETLFSNLNGTEAAAEATRLLALYKVPRDIFDVTIPLEVFVSAAVEMMSIVNLTLNRFGLDAGRKYRVIGITYELAVREIILSLWG